MKEKEPKIFSLLSRIITAKRENCPEYKRILIIRESFLDCALSGIFLQLFFFIYPSSTRG